MKTSFKVLISVALVAGMYACKPSPEQIQASAGTLMSINKQVDSVYTLLNNSYESYQPAAMDKALEDLQKFLLESNDRIQQMETLDETKTLQKALIDKIELMQYIASHESKEQVRIYKLPDEAFSNELRVQWDGLAHGVEIKVREADDNLQKVYSEIISNSKK